MDVEETVAGQAIHFRMPQSIPEVDVFNGII